MRRDQGELDAMRDEFKTARPYRCADGYCGAEDCARCCPSTYHLTDEDDETTTAEKGETMTTPAAAANYLAEHLEKCRDNKWAIYNPANLPESELPVIYGFNNGGSMDFLSAVAIAQDGTVLGGHCCSHEGYMPHDLGIIEGSRPDRHEQSYRVHYPNGYRMEFVGRSEASNHPGLKAAFAEYDKKNPAEKGETHV